MLLFLFTDARADLGSGGIICFPAARQVGPTGHIIGVGSFLILKLGYQPMFLLADC